MTIVVGLGNPGKKYDLTRHNLGQTVVKNLAKNLDYPAFKLNKNLKTEISQLSNLILTLPVTYMNASGEAVKLLADYFNVSSPDIWVIHDDLDISFGNIKISKNHSAAGHKGVESIIEYLKTQDFVRFRIGIGPQINADNIGVNPPASPSGGRSNQRQSAPLTGEQIVLQKFSKNEQKIVKDIIQMTVDAIKLAIKDGVDTAMNKYN